MPYQKVINAYSQKENYYYFVIDSKTDSPYRVNRKHNIHQRKNYITPDISIDEYNGSAEKQRLIYGNNKIIIDFAAKGTLPLKNILQKIQL